MKLYAGLTDQRERYTPDSRMKLYAGLTDKVLQDLLCQSSKNQPEKTVRRTHG